MIMKKKQSNYAIFGAVGILIIALALMLMPVNGKQLSGRIFVEKYTQTKNAELVDVRTPGEYSASHIEGAVNIDYENQSFENKIKKLDTSKTYFVYCRSGNRSGKAVAIMKSNGFQNIYELKGGTSMYPELLSK